MNSLKRRQLLGLFASTVVVASLPTLTACQGLPPKPFTTGRTVTPPQGCTELRQRDQQGDC